MFPNGAVKTFEGQHLVVPRRKVKGDFDPDQVACDLISVVYAAFSVERKLIQFHTSEGNFVFPVF